MVWAKQSIDLTRLALACLSGLLLTASFPMIGKGAVAWFALVPLLAALKNLSAFDGLRIGFLAGLIHYLTLFYWFIPFLNTYGPFPVFICMGILFLLASYLAIYVGLFSMALTWIGMPVTVKLFAVPTLWVALEYMRSIIFSGFPWELLGHTQYNALHIIQVSDIVGVYGISFLIVLFNGLLMLLYPFSSKRKIRIKKQTKIRYGPMLSWWGVSLGLSGAMVHGGCPPYMTKYLRRPKRKSPLFREISIKQKNGIPYIRHRPLKSI